MYDSRHAASHTAWTNPSKSDPSARAGLVRVPHASLGRQEDVDLHAMVATHWASGSWNQTAVEESYAGLVRSLLTTVPEERLMLRVQYPHVDTRGLSPPEAARQGALALYDKGRTQVMKRTEQHPNASSFEPWHADSSNPDPQLDARRVRAG
jgi:hypothetical protein